MTGLLTKYDYLLKETGPAAIILKQPLMPAEGRDAVIFPPTYAAPKDDPNKKPRYNRDAFEGDKHACALDSVGSQANRVEPLFKGNRYSHLVPQLIVTHRGGATNVLDAGHRVADAIVRFSELLVDIHNAFVDFGNGNAAPMAKLAPTSLVFGAWDSRGTQIKIPRLINLRIDATDVEFRSRSAQYVPATDYVGNGLIDEVDESTGSDLGFAAVPAVGQLGGIRVRGEITRTGSLNLAALQALGNGSEASDLQRYILALALISLTAFENSVFTLRQGCQLVADKNRPRTLTEIMPSGIDSEISLHADEVLTFATEAAESFGVGASRTVAFDSALANRIRELWGSEATQEKLKGIAKLRPLNMAELDRFEEGDNDPLQTIVEAIKAVKGSKKYPGKLPPKAARDKPPIAVQEVFTDVRAAISALLEQDGVEPNVKEVCQHIESLISVDSDSHKTLKEIERLLKEFRKSRTGAVVAGGGAAEPAGEQP